MFYFFTLSSVWNTRFRVFSNHTDYPRELKLIGAERIIGYHHVSWLSISVKPKNMKETTLVLRVCVFMTTRSWTNVWHTTFTICTQMSVLQCGGCLNIFICQLCGKIVSYILIAITPNLSGNRFQTPISSYKMYNPRVVRFQLTPYVCILKSRWRTSLAVSAMLTDHIRSSLFITTTHRRAKAHCTDMRPSVCKHALACDYKFLHAVRRLPTTSPWETPLDHCG